jgi:nitrate reductase NapAB chaperone NapD
MPVCSYLVIAAEGEAGALATRLSGLCGCEVVRAANDDVLLLVTDSEGAEAEAALLERLAVMEGIEALLLTFGELGPATGEGVT